MSAPATGPAPDSAGPSSGVASVALSVPSALLAVAGSPITRSGTLALSLPVRPANVVFAGPSSGADAVPAFRALTGDDLPLTPAAASAVSNDTLIRITIDGQQYDILAVAVSP